MALHPDFPCSPYGILDPDIRRFPADEALRESSYEKLLSPLVHELREKVARWRDNNYEGAADMRWTSLWGKGIVMPSFPKALKMVFMS